MQEKNCGKKQKPVVRFATEDLQPGCKGGKLRSDELSSQLYIAMYSY